MGIYGTVFSIGTMAGPALLEFTGTRGWQPFVIRRLRLLLTLAPLIALGQADSPPQRLHPDPQAEGCDRRRAVHHAGGPGRRPGGIGRLGAAAAFRPACRVPRAGGPGVGRGVHGRQCACCRPPSGYSPTATGAACCSASCAAASAVGPLLLPAVDRQPGPAVASPVHLGRHAVRLLQPGNRPAGRGVQRVGISPPRTPCS